MTKILIKREKREFVPELNKEVVTVKAANYDVEDTNKDYSTSYGTIDKKDLKKTGKINANIGKELIAYDADFLDKFKHIKRLPQTISLKDIGIIIAETGVNSESNIVDSGTGSGALTCYLAHICKKVTTYETRDEHREVAETNATMLALKNITIKKTSAYEGFDEKNADLVTLDLPEPWKAIVAAKKTLKNGGYLINYSPSTTSAMEFINELNKHEEFFHIKTIELLERLWTIQGKIVHPKAIEIGHTGFITIVRKILS